MLLAQVLATIIFVGMFAAIISGRVHRYIAALVGAALTLVVVFIIALGSPRAAVDVLSLGDLLNPAFWVPGQQPFISHGVNWQTVVFIAGMMVMVEGLREVGFFRWICLVVAKMVGFKVPPLMVTFMLLAGFLAMFIDSLTVLLFLTSVTIELARTLKFNPVPMIIGEIFAANTGGSATLAGDPPNIIIGTASGYSFGDFALNTGPAAWLGMAAAVLFFYLVFRRTLSPPDSAVTPLCPEPGEAVRNPYQFRMVTAVFLLVVALLVTHDQTGISVALIGVIAAGLTLAVVPGSAGRIIGEVDWRTVLFFIGLFICVGGLDATGVLGSLADSIGRLSGGSTVIAITIILWASTFASAVVDNIPFAAAMVPVISRLAQAQGLDLGTLSWTLALGTDIGGNATPIGASANVVATAIAEREGYPIGWRRYLKYAVPATVIVIAICQVYLVVRYG